MTSEDRKLVAEGMRSLLVDVDAHINAFIEGQTTGEVLDLHSIDSTRKAAVSAINLVVNTLAQDFLRPEHHQMLQDRVQVLRELSVTPDFFKMVAQAWKLYVAINSGDRNGRKKTNIQRL
jgi:hypothetical protein